MVFGMITQADPTTIDNKPKESSSKIDAMKRKKKKDEEFSKANEPAGITGSN